MVQPFGDVYGVFACVGVEGLRACSEQRKEAEI